MNIKMMNQEKVPTSVVKTVIIQNDSNKDIIVGKKGETESQILKTTGIKLYAGGGIITLPGEASDYVVTDKWGKFLNT